MKRFAYLLPVLVWAVPAAAQHAHHGAPAGDTAGLARQIMVVRSATERYLDHQNAVADGYRKFGVDGPLMGEHWYHPDLVKGALDLYRPATLQYAVIDGKRTLVGVAYNVYQRPGEPLPDGFAGTTDVWHVHDVPNLARALVDDRPFLKWVVGRREKRGKLGAGAGRTQLVMLHAWVWSENPDGLFAQMQRALPYQRAGLPVEWVHSGDEAAAWGTALLKDGCSFELNRLKTLGGISAAQQTTLRSACTRATERVKEAATSRTDAAFNAAAGAAWREFESARDGSLTADQKRRLASVMAPMHPH